MKPYQYSLLYSCLVLCRVAAGADDSSSCSTSTFRVFDFPVGGPWLVFRESVVDPMPLQVSGFADEAKAKRLSSQLECTAQYGSSFQVSGVTISKGNVDYEQDSLDRATTRAFRNAKANGLWYVSVDASGLAKCKWILKVTGCHQDGEQDESGNGNKQNNKGNHRNVGGKNDSNNYNGENDNSSLGEEQSKPPLNMQTLPPSSSPSDSPSQIPSLSPSDAPSIFPSDVPSMHPSVVPSMSPSDAPSFIPSNRPSGVPSDTPSMIPTILPTMAYPSDVPSLVSVASSAVPSDMPSSVPSQRMEPTQRPGLSLVDKDAVMPSSSPSFLAFSDAPSDMPSDLPSSALIPETLAPSASETTVDSQSTQQSSQQPVPMPTYDFDDDIFQTPGIKDSSAARSRMAPLSLAALTVTALLIGCLL